MHFGYRLFPFSLAGFPRFLRRLAKAADGVETIEFALVSIALFTFLFGVVEFGRLYWTRTELQNAAEAAARYVTVNPGATTSAIQAYAATKVYGITVEASDFTVTPYISTTNTPACGNQVTVNYTFKFIAAGLLFHNGTVNLSTTACHQA